MFEVFNYAGTPVAMYNQQELDQAIKQGLIHSTDTVIDIHTGQRVS